MCKTATIICNGLFPRKAYPRYLIASSDYILCCDGGAASYLKAAPKIFGQMRDPDVIIGDLDSIQPKIRQQYADRIVHVSEQDDNDMTKAFNYVRENLPDVDTVHFIAATGLREDHTIGNVSLLMEYMRMYDLSHMTLDMVSDYSTIFAVSDSVTLEVGTGRRVSDAKVQMLRLYDCRIFLANNGFLLIPSILLISTEYVCLNKSFATSSLDLGVVFLIL